MDELKAEIIYFAPGELTPNPLNPRGPVSPAEPGMDELVASVREKGVLQPLIITSDGVIVIGHRRHAAALVAESTTVPCIVKDYDVIEQQEIMLIENLQRQDLNPLQEARAYLRLEEAGINHHEIARRCSVHYSRVNARIPIAQFPPDIGALFGDLELPVGAAPVLARIEGEDDLRRIAGMIVTRRLALPAIVKLVKQTVSPPKKPRNYERKGHAERPRGIVRDELVSALTSRQAEHVAIGDLVRELDYVCCACGMNDTAERRATLCSACPLAAFLNRFARIPLRNGTPAFDLMAKTAPEAAQ